MDRVIRIEAINQNGDLLIGANFTIWIDGILISKIENSKGIATIQLPERERSVVVRSSFGRTSRKIKLASNVEVMQIQLNVVDPVNDIDRKAKSKKGRSPNRARKAQTKSHDPA